MSKENITQEFRLQNIERRSSYLIEEIIQNELMSKKHKKVYRVLNYIENLLILVSTVTGCLYVSAFASLVGNSIEITRSAIGLKTCVITAGIKKYKSITKTKKRSMIK